MEYDEAEIPRAAAIRSGQIRRVGRYAVIKKLATGGMASVYLAHVQVTSNFQKLVAIKRPHPHLVVDPAMLAMFLDEARLLASLDHENICPIVDFGTDEDGPYIVMPYLHGEALAEVLELYIRRKSGAPSDLTAYVGAAVCDGLWYAHNQVDAGRPVGLVHRDVSPQNVFITYDGAVKLLDFGLAKAVRIDSGGSNPGGSVNLKGKYGYMSPEQVRGEPIDARSDLFSLGVVLWESIAGRRLFKRPNASATLLAIEKGEIPPLDAVRSVEPELAEIIGRALALERRDRYASAREMGRDLRRFLVRRESVLCATEIAVIMRENFPARAFDRDPLASVTVRHFRPEEPAAGPVLEAPARAPIADDVSEDTSGDDTFDSEIGAAVFDPAEGTNRDRTSQVAAPLEIAPDTATDVRAVDPLVETDTADEELRSGPAPAAPITSGLTDAPSNSTVARVESAIAALERSIQDGEVAPLPDRPAASAPAETPPEPLRPPAAAFRSETLTQTRAGSSAFQQAFLGGMLALVALLIGIAFWWFFA